MLDLQYKPVLLDGVVDLADNPTPDAEWFDAYRRRGGYRTLEKVLHTMTPAEVVECVKASGLRGRGGAGFPTGVKWGFLPKDSKLPVYLVCNGDESEPGTCKDRPILEQRPHLLLEGIAISAYAIGSHTAFLYIRGEYFHAIEVMNRAIEEARARGVLGLHVLGTDFSLDIVVHSGAGAYICGEESAMLNSIEGRVGWPRLRPPFPAQKGLYGCPTIINNVETLAKVVPILERGPEWFHSLGTERSGGFRIYSVSGHVKRPGNYEAPMRITLRQLIYDLAGGIRDDRPLKAVIPGGSSVPILTADHLDTQMSFEGVEEAGSLLGSAATIVFDDTVCMVWAARNMAQFYRHESCGQCTPCRQGTAWLYKILDRIESGRGRLEDLDLLQNIPTKIEGRCVCALGDAACAAVKSGLHYFRREFEQHIERGRCPFEKPYTQFV
ncbi:MAG: NADH-quinone oxidoreductase subunit NuoF [Candidatus Sumerlaeia bacterium]|nr:NADH-quinone oxidoreductase subunit NuoF [Candidatus Sumerlaeia bacterium]